eukprot:TRINITY_DN37138_c0_g1_i1.p1 TRINITY_DN37138_c0_g1~~TRINITY_DN37138_c0_g1_i1.p1  ORF type:complete len:827 (-),score=165.69 TRINITY_DN37138_c0_g1_i1:71-2551(-)
MAVGGDSRARYLKLHSTEQRWWQRIDVGFKSSILLSGQVAGWISLLAAVALIYGRERLHQHGYPAKTIVCNILFLVGKDLGSTLKNMFYGIIGSLVAMLTSFLMHGFMPNGYVGTNPGIWWIGVGIVVVYVLIFMFLKLNDSARCFALIKFVGYAMLFLDPATDVEDFSANFTLNLDGVAEHQFVLYILSAVIALLVFLIPRCVFALSDSHTLVEDTARDLFSLVTQLIEFYSGPGATLQVFKLQHLFSQLKGRLNEAQAKQSSSWFESCGRSKRRAMNKPLLRMVDEILLRWEPLFPIIAAEDFTETHHVVMAKLRQPLLSCVERTSDVVMGCSALTWAGRPSEADLERMREKVAEIRTAVARVHAALSEVTAQFGREAVQVTVLGEHQLVHTMCSTFLGVADHVSALLESEPTASAVCSACKKHIGGYFDISPDAARWAARSSLAILINFGIGIFGFCSPTMDDYSGGNCSGDATCYLSPHNPSLAVTNVILMSNMSGSTLSSALDRLHAVVFAGVVGQLGYKLLGWCGTVFRVLSGIFVFLLTQVFMYFGYAGGPNASLGTRLAAISASALMAKCSNEPGTHLEYSAAYHALSDIIIAVLVMLVVDLVFGEAASSVKAVSFTSSALSSFQNVLHGYFGGNLAADDVIDQLGEIRAQISKADTYANDAANEPKVWRPRFNAHLHQEISTAFVKLFTTMHGLARCQRDDRERLVGSLPSIAAVRSEILDEADYTVALATAALRAEADDKAQVDELVAQRRSRTLPSLPKLIAEMNEQGEDEESAPEKPTSPHEGLSARRSVVCMKFQTIFRQLREAQEAIARNSA